MRRLALAFTGATVLLVACASPKSDPGIPITGLIDFADGNLAPLTAQDGVGTGFDIDAVLGSQQVVVTNASWKCYTPAPPDFPNFDIEATDGATYGLFVSIDPPTWGTGAKTIDGEHVRLLLSLRNDGVTRFGVATAGTITFTAAGSAADTSGHNCSFSMNGVTISGLES